MSMHIAEYFKKREIKINKQKDNLKITYNDLKQNKNNLANI